ncbi:hypothetical protein [Enterobacter cloacae]|uniref:hypothetical protein n=3 Tax=Enterobacterales TaxID=91347 RepID=UPI0028E8A119|nr:hypothetical protein [Enterobacter cloacae]ELY2911741.1 hypothetical protein [Cronobacter sakazakii]
MMRNPQVKMREAASIRKKLQRDTLVKKFGRLIEIYIHEDMEKCLEEIIKSGGFPALDVDMLKTTEGRCFVIAELIGFTYLQQCSTVKNKNAKIIREIHQQVCEERARKDKSVSAVALDLNNKCVYSVGKKDGDIIIDDGEWTDAKVKKMSEFSTVAKIIINLDKNT